MLVWIGGLTFGLVGTFATAWIGYLSPFGRTRRGMVEAMQKELDLLNAKVLRLEGDMSRMSAKLELCETERGRLERENYRLYRQLDHA